MYVYDMVMAPVQIENFSVYHTMLVLIGLFLLGISKPSGDSSSGKKLGVWKLFRALMVVFGLLAFSTGFVLILLGEPFTVFSTGPTFLNIGGAAIMLAALAWSLKLRKDERLGIKVSPFSEFNSLLSFILGMSLFLESRDGLMNMPVIGMALYIVLFSEKRKSVTELLNSKKNNRQIDDDISHLLFFFSKNQEFTASSELRLLLVNSFMFIAAGASSLLFASFFGKSLVMNWYFTFTVLSVAFVLSILAKSVVYHRDYAHIMETRPRIMREKKRGWTLSLDALVLSVIYALFLVLYFVFSSMFFTLVFEGLGGIILGIVLALISIVPFSLLEGVYFLSLVRIFDGQEMSDSMIGAVRDLMSEGGARLCKNVNRERLITLVFALIAMALSLYMLMNDPSAEVQWFSLIGSALIYILVMTHLDVITYEEMLEFRLKKLHA